MSDSSSFNLLAVAWVLYRIGVPIMGLYFLYVHATEHVHGFFSFIGYLLLSSIEGLVWPVAVFWV